MTLCNDPVIRNQWHVICALEDIRPGNNQTTLLGESIGFCIDTNSHGIRAWRLNEPGDTLPVTCAYGYLWTCPGSPDKPLFALPEYNEPDRRNVCAATIGVRVSAPRAVENFLDMGHFPYVHTGILGEQPHTEVREYDVTIEETTNDVIATRCRFYQPMAAAGSEGGMLVEYVYRVPHPYCSVLYKSCPSDEKRMDVIALFVQPVTEETIRAHALVSVIDEHSTDLSIRMFQQTIFGQDKPILENQFPKRLPLDPRAETPIRADKSAIVYRRWLSDLGITYGVIPAAA
ncbi:(2Fe-2S)-binding protein [Chromatiales bacterium (ex Bugula neritina AB1)]|nr:(2Fe-2S)-binding protein [Chromatiales bacterium (ex Bugula neritina AB1)]